TRARGHQLGDLIDRQSVRTHEVEQHTGIEITGARTHEETAVRRQSHTRVNASTIAKRRETRAATQVRDHDPAPESSVASQMVHDVFAGQSVEAVTLHTAFRECAWQPE